MKTKIILPFAVLILFLTACLTPPALSPTQTLPTPPAPSEQITAAPSTPVALPPATATPETVPAATESAPTEIAFEDLPALVMAASQPETLFTSVSPDGQWQAKIVRYDCVQVGGPDSDQNAYEQVVITGLSDDTQTIAADQLQFCGGLGAYGLNERYWSSNSRYYYFDEARWGVPDGNVCGLWNPGFSRVDVETGQLERLPGNGMVVNADGIMVGWANQELVLWDLNAGEISRSPFAVENFTLRSLQMSPEGDSFVYLLTENCDPANGKSVLVLYTLEDQNQTILIDTDELGYGYAIWETATLLLLLDMDGNQWHYDLATDELVAVTPPAP